MTNSSLTLRLTFSVLLIFGLLNFVQSQSNHTVTFTGASSDFNSAERISASAGSTDYYITFDASVLYIGAFRTSGVFASDDNLTIYLDTDPDTNPSGGTGSTSGQTYNGVSGTLPFSANYNVHAEQSIQEARSHDTGWLNTISGLTYSTGTTWREVAIPFSSIGTPDALYLTLWMGQSGAIYSNAPGADLGGVANPAVVDYIGGFGVSSADCIPVNTLNRPVTATLTNAVPVSGVTYGRVLVSSGSITATNDFNIASGGRIDVSGGTFNISNRSIVFGGTTIGSGGGTAINYTGGTLLSNASTSLIFHGEGIFTGSALTFNGSIVANRKFTPLAAGATTLANGASFDLRPDAYLNNNTFTYNVGSTLIYNTGTTTTADIEWTSNSTGAAGVPANVVIGNVISNTVVTFGNSSQYRHANGSITISNATSGNGLTLSTAASGDLQLTGNFIQNGTFTHNSRTIGFVGSSAQTVSGSLNTSGSTNNFAFVTINNSHPDGVLFNSDVRITASTGEVLQISNTGRLSIAASTTLTLENNGGNIRAAGGARTIRFEGANSVMNFTGTKTITQTGGGTLTFSSVSSFGTVELGAAVNFGSGLSTIGNNTYLRINSGGSVSSNSPVYAVGSTLNYNTGAAVGRGTEWNSNNPNNVLISNSGTSLNLPNGVNGTARTCTGNLTIEDGCSLSMGAMSAAFTVGGDINIGNGTSGTLTLSSAGGGNLNVGGNFTKTSGTFTANARTITFNGSAAQVFTSNSAETINTLIVSNTVGLVSLNSSLSITSAITFNTNTNSVIGSSAVISIADGDSFNGNNSGSAITVHGTLRNNGTNGGTINSSASTLIFSSTGTYDHNMTRAGAAASGTSLGTIPAATWNSGSTVLISALTNPASGGWFGGSTQTFSNFEWNTPSMTTDPSMAGSTLTANESFTITNLNNRTFRLGTGTSGGTINCGDYTQSNGTVNLNAGSSGSGTINCSGNFNLSAGTITETSTGVNHLINFNGSTQQQITISASPSNDINYTFYNPGGFALNSVLNISNNRTVRRSQGNFAGTGSISYGTGTNLIYDTNSSLTTSDYEWPVTSGPVNVTINKSGGVVLHNSRTISGVLTLTSGVLELGSNDLTISNGATGAITGTYNASSMIATNGTGQLIRTINTGGNTYFFPIGDITGTVEYSPVSIAFSANSVSRQLGVNVIDANHPQLNTSPTQTDYISRYWEFSNSAGGTYTYTGTFTYTAADVVGSAANVRANMYNGSTWTQAIASSSAGNVLSITTNETNSSLPFGATAQFTGRVNNGSTYVWNQTGTSAFGTASNWTPARTTPRADDILVYNNGANTTSTGVTNQTIGKLLISNNTTVTLQSSSDQTLTIGGGNGDDLEIASGSHLRLGSTGGNAITLAFSNATISTIDGSLSLLANTAFDNAVNFNNTVATVNGSIFSAGNVTGTASNLLFTSGSNYYHNHTTTAGSIPVASWDVNSTCTIQGYTSNATPPGNRSQSFGHFTWNCASQSQDIQLDGGLTTVNGNFTVSSTGSGNDELRLNDDTNYTLNIGGNFTITGSDVRLTQSNGNYTATVNVEGSYSQTGGGSTFVMNNGDNNTTSRLFVKGDFNLGAGSITQPSGGTNNNIIEFNGTTIQNITIAGSLPSGQQMNYRFNNAAGFNLTGSINVNNASTLYRRLGEISGGTITYNATGSALIYEGSTTMITGVEFPATNGPEDVTINSSSVITLSGSRTLPTGGVFTSSNGVFVLGDYDLTLLNTGASALINYSPSATRMIAADGNGQLRRALPNAARDLQFYIGDVTGTPEYSALRLNFSANSVNNRIVGVRVVQDTSSNLSLPYAPIDYLDRHWIVTLSSTSGSYSYIPSMTYSPGDVVGTENNLQVAAFPFGGSSWNHYPTSIGSNVLVKTGAALTQTNFSLHNAQFSGRTPVKYWDGSESTAWSDADNWTPSGVPNSGDNIDFNGNAAQPCILTGSATVNHLTLSDGGDLSLASGSSLNVGGNFTYNPLSATSFDCNSTFTLSNTVFNQLVPALTYGNLNLGSGARTLDSSGTINICGNYTPTSGSVTVTGSTVDFVGSTAQGILSNSTSFNNLNISNTSANVNSGNNVTVVGAMNVIESARFNNSAGNLTIASGASANVSGFLRNRGTVTPTGTLTFTSTGTYEHDFTNNAGTIPASTWNAGSTCLIMGYTGNDNTPSGLNQAFHHFTWNCQNQNDDINLNGGLSTVNGDFKVIETGTGQLRMTGNADETMNIGGNFEQTGGELILVSGSGDIFINVTGDYIQTGGYVDFTLSDTGYGEVIMQGNYRREGTGIAITTGLSPNGVFRFAGTNQTITESSTGDVKWIDFEINNGSTTTLLTDLPLNGTGSYVATITPLSGGILDCQTFLITNTGTTRVTVPTGGTIRTGHPEGLASSGASGTVRTSSRIYNSGGSYVFNGNVDQNTGNFFTTTSTANTVANLTIANTAATVTLNSGTNPTVTNTLNFTAENTANFNVGSQTIYVSNNSTSAVNRAGSGHVIGNLRRAFSAGTNTYSFPVGGSVNYAPVSLDLVASAAGSLTVRTTDGVHPNAATHGMSQTSYINRYWTVTANSGTLTSNAATFTYTPADIVNNATAETLRLKRYSAGWTAPAYSSVLNNITATTLNNTTTYGDFFAAADCSAFTATITPSSSTTICDGSSVDLAATTNITGSTYVWSPATGLSSSTAATPVASPTATITYTVTATSPQNCVDTETVTVTVNPRPTASVSGSATICNGESTTISIGVTGSGAISGTLNPGAIAFSGTAPSIDVVVSPTSTTTYSVATLNDANCASNAGDLTGTHVVNVNARPTAAISGSATICNGESTNLSIDVTGTGPWSGTLSGGVSFSGSTSPIVVSVNPSSTTTYTIATLSDASCNAGMADFSGAATITVNPLPTAYVIADGTICYGGSTLVTFGGTPGATVTYNINGGSDQTIVIGAGGVSDMNTVALTGNQTYNLLEVDNGLCSQILSESATVYVLPQLTAGISGSSSICDGSSTTITFTGSAGATVTYTVNGGADQMITLDGSGNASLNTGNVYDATRTYSLVSVALDECSAAVTGSAVITTLELPEATISGATSICSGQNTNITFNGDPGATVTYNINGGSDLTVVLNGSGVATVNSGALTNNTTYNLLEVDNGTCSEEQNAFVEITIINIEFFEDTDGDGFGDAMSSVFACTAPVGYVADNTDCDDSDSSINPNTQWYADIDGDGYGSYIYTTQCSDPLIAGVVILGGDCDDDNAAIYPGSTELCGNGIDDDCDGVIDEGCAPAPSNDSWSSAITIPVAGNVYPSCQIYAGTLTGATVSPESSPTGVVTGEDVWYKFQTISSGVRINLTNAAFDGVIQLYDHLGSLVEHENVVGLSSNEHLNVGSLVAGNWYYVAVRNYNSSVATGNFNLCLQRLAAGSCTGGGGTMELCSNFKPAWTGASQYITTFTSVPGGVVTTHTSTGQFPLSIPAAALEFSTSYSTSVAAVYNLTNGAGASEVINVPSNSPCTITIGSQPDVQVKESQICPATVFRNSLLHYKPFVCGAVDFELRFTRVDNDNNPIALPFTVLRGAPVSTLHLSFSGPNQLVNGGRYMVEVRPIMPSGPGVFGTPQCIQLVGAALEEPVVLPAVQTHTKSGAEDMNDVLIYPNPTRGDMINLVLQHAEAKAVEIRIIDAVGRVIKSVKYGFDSYLNAEIHFDSTLTGGLYTMEMRMDNGSVSTARFMVSK